ncbi:hypothetical protein CCS01_22615 [Rhodopila globiformis]|jgi:hypothetical protein|uniref:Uncharacterized protein n=2 Tax=Rhodopila globiformis TaxID=1071 RepID=A0A2S6N3A8_RHOGL|nr:hypothetical protein CCS01_22615 [Rhodopila globiformis]
MLSSMKVYIFQSGKEPDMVGFTVDAAGANLPTALAPWAAWTAWTASEEEAAIEASPEAPAPATAGASAAAMAVIERDGFYVARAETIAHMTGIPWVR